MNTPLGAAIEQSVVENLNDLREIWDPSEAYKLYPFSRQAQVFPDVRLQTTAPGTENPILMGIELKGWFVLAKEGEPSFGYTVAPSVCADADLLVVYPWALDEVISGAPKLMSPFIEEARFAAEQRNYYWKVLRGVAGTEAEIRSAQYDRPYPAKNQRFNERAVTDAGKNFGRIARAGIMSEFIARLDMQELSGIPVTYWRRFLRIFAEGTTEQQAQCAIDRLAEEALPLLGGDDHAVEAITALREALAQLLALRQR